MTDTPKTPNDETPTDGSPADGSPTTPATQDPNQKARPTSIVSALANTPPLPVSGLRHLPRPIRRALPLFTERAERDVFTTAALGVLSGCLPRVWGRGDTGRYSPHLYALVTAPAASGKGVLSHARKLGEEIENLFQDELLEAKRGSETEDQSGTWADVPEGEPSTADSSKVNPSTNTGPKSGLLFDAEPAEVLAPSTPQKSGSDNSAPEDEPILRRLFLSGDISSSALVQFMDQNGGVQGEGFGILYETEIDTVVKTQRQEWGGTSDVLRKAHAHETVSLLRVGKERGGEGRKIDRPTLAVVLAGTPNQLLRLLPSPEDGLYSRFLFYGFLPGDPLTWKDVRPRDDAPDPSEVLAEGAREVRRLWTVLEGRESDLAVKLRPHHWDALNARMQAVKETLFRRFDYAGASTAHRAGLHVFRIASVLAVWRAFEGGDDLGREETVTVTDGEFEAALALGLTYARHAAAIMRALPRDAGSVIQMADDEAALFVALPSAFQTAEAVETGRGLGTPRRTVQRWLETWVKTGRLRRVRKGHYEKPGAPRPSGPQPSGPTPSPEPSGSEHRDEPVLLEKE